MNVLITGGAGLIGQAIAKKHVAVGDSVYLWDSCVNKFNDYSNLIGTNVYGTCAIADALMRYQIELVSHQAARVGVGESQYAFEDYYQANVGFTAELMSAIKNNQKTVRKILFAGSMGPYGEGPRICRHHGEFYVTEPRTRIEIPCPVCGKDSFAGLISETTPIYPLSQYAVTKTTQETMLRVFAQTYGIPTISLRYFSVYGSKSSPDNPYTGVLSIIAHKMLRTGVIDVNEDGTQTRDLVHVDDLANAHYLASRCTETPLFDAINLGTGVSTSFFAAAHLMMRRYGITVPISPNKTMRIGDIKDSCADISKAKRVLRWKPNISLLDGVGEYCTYLKEFFTHGLQPQAFIEAKQKLLENNLLRG